MYRLKHISRSSVINYISVYYKCTFYLWPFSIGILHLLQKRALRKFVNNTDYVAHSEPICKNLRLLKMLDMFRFALWKFYFKLMNNKLPPPILKT